MVETEKGIYSFPIPLPGNPLKWLNCYVLKGDCGRNLLIDSGFHRKECTEALFAGMEELGLSPDNTDILFTHLHADHTGNGYELYKRNYRILMGKTDHDLMTGDPGRWFSRASVLGIPESTLKLIMDSNPAMKYDSLTFEADPINDGDVLEYAGRKLSCIMMPGHTPGLFCLYDAEDKVLFSSDHVLFDITPNIVSWQQSQDSLGNYLASLERIRSYDVRRCLPAHRTDGGKTMVQRVDEIIAHHKNRLEETYAAVKACPGATANEVAANVRWNIRAKNWDEFPAGQKWFAVGETFAHLEYLEARGRLRHVTGSSGACEFHICPAQEERT